VPLSTEVVGDRDGPATVGAEPARGLVGAGALGIDGARRGATFIVASRTSR
jgi:hypothetical protein